MTSSTAAPRARQVTLQSPISIFKKFRGRRVLVTGAGGFIGSHLTEALVACGATVTGFFRYTSLGSLGQLDNSPCRDRIFKVFGDIRDSDAIDRAVAGQEYVFHLAAHIGIPFSYLSPRDFLEVNAVGTTHLLQSTRKISTLKRVIIASTSEVYGSAQRTPMDESHPTHPQSPYAASKLAAEKMATAFSLSYELPVTVVRPFNCYGPRQSARAIIPTVIIQALRGNNIRVGRTDTRRDFTYVDDTVDGIMRLALSPRAAGEVVNICAGSAVSIDDTIQITGQILKKRLTTVRDKRRVRPEDSEVDLLIGDNSRAFQLCGYRSQVSLRDGLSQTIKFFRENLKNYAAEDYQI